MFQIVVPKEFRSDVAGYGFISGILPAVLSQQDAEITIDFDTCCRIDANLSAALGAILDRIIDSGFRVFLKYPPEKQVRKALARIHFLKAWNVHTRTEERDNFVEYRRFGSEDVASFMKYIDAGIIRNPRFPRHTDLAGSKILESILEIYVNACTHGKTDFVYSCGEYKEDSNWLEMTIVDCGRTIPNNVNEFLSSRNIPSLGHCDAISWAFIEGHTTKNEPGGLGLAILKDFIRMNNGELQVVSGFGMVEYDGRKSEQSLLEMLFPGTIVNMKFNFDDQKNYYMASESKDINMNDLL